MKNKWLLTGVASLVVSVANFGIARAADEK
jgi:hypothetical protein